MILTLHDSAGNGVAADYLDTDNLRDLGLDDASIERLLSGSYWTGHGGRAVVDAEQISHLTRATEDRSWLV